MWRMIAFCPWESNEFAFIGFTGTTAEAKLTALHDQGLILFQHSLLYFSLEKCRLWTQANTPKDSHTVHSDCGKSGGFWPHSPHTLTAKWDKDYVKSSRCFEHQRGFATVSNKLLKRATDPFVLLPKVFQQIKILSCYHYMLPFSYHLLLQSVE